MEEMDHFYCVYEREREEERNASMFDVCRENNHPGGKGVEENVRTKGGATDKIKEKEHCGDAAKRGDFSFPPTSSAAGR